MSNVTYSPNHRQADALMIHILSTLRNAPGLCKTASLAVLLVAKVIHIQSVRSRICVYAHTFSTIQRRWSGKINKKFGDSSECHVSYVRQPCPQQSRTWLLHAFIAVKFAVPVGLVHTKGYSVLHKTPFTMCRMKGSPQQMIRKLWQLEFLINHSCLLYRCVC